MTTSNRRWVIWGLRNVRDTLRYVYNHFYTSLRTAGREVLWVDDEERHQSCIRPNDIVLCANVACAKLPLMDNVKYCLHNCPPALENKIRRSNFLKLQVYTSSAANSSEIERWKTFVIFDKVNQTLYQPWGTNLERNEFLRPSWRGRLPLVFWVGSIWNNAENQGNVAIIGELKRSLQRHDLGFQAVRHVPDWMNVFLMRRSKIAPAFGGEWQSKVGYLPCRLFKNISYGQLGISNVLAFRDLFGNTPSISTDIPTAIDFALSLSEPAWKHAILEQQEAVSHYTYRNSINNIERAFESLS